MKVPTYGQAPLEALGPPPDETMLLMAAATMRDLGRIPDPFNPLPEDEPDGDD